MEPSSVPRRGLLLLLLAGGLFLAWALDSLRTYRRNAATVIHEPVPASTAARSPGSIEGAPSGEQKKDADNVPKERPHSEAGVNAAPLVLNRKPAALLDLEQRLNFDLGEEQIHRVEESLSKLPRQAYTTAREAGWELHLVADDSVFVGLGFRDGDLITYRSLDAVSPYPQLTARVVAILESLER